MANLSRSEELRTYLSENIEYIVNHVNERFDESENEIRSKQESSLMISHRHQQQQSFDELSTTNFPTRGERKITKKLEKECKSLCQCV